MKTEVIGIIVLFIIAVVICSFGLSHCIKRNKTLEQSNMMNKLLVSSVDELLVDNLKARPMIGEIKKYHIDNNESLPDDKLLCFIYRSSDCQDCINEELLENHELFNRNAENICYITLDYSMDLEYFNFIFEANEVHRIQVPESIEINTNSDIVTPYCFCLDQKGRIINCFQIKAIAKSARKEFYKYFLESY